MRVVSGKKLEFINDEDILVHPSACFVCGEIASVAFRVLEYTEEEAATFHPDSKQWSHDQLKYIVSCDAHIDHTKLFPMTESRRAPVHLVDGTNVRLLQTDPAGRIVITK